MSAAASRRRQRQRPCALASGERGQQHCRLVPVNLLLLVHRGVLYRDAVQLPGLRQSEPTQLSCKVLETATRRFSTIGAHGYRISIIGHESYAAWPASK
eukprot:1782280-Pleurochrysis_carterae.AAC.1